MRNSPVLTRVSSEHSNRPARFKRHLWLIAGLLGFGLFPQIAPCLETAPSGASELIVRLHEGKLSVEAKNVSWDEILKQVGAKTGIRFHSSIPLDERTSVSFEGLAAKEALRQILGAETNMFLRYPDRINAATPGALPAEVWILGRGQNVTQQDTTPAESGSAEQSTADATQANVPQDVKPLTPIQLKETLGKLRTGTAEDRAQAILRLSAHAQTDDEVRSALDSAMSDAHPQVRALAMQRLASQGEPKAAAEYIRQGLHDPDPEVRMAALASLSPGTEDGHLVREALHDPNEAVRTRAAELMKGLGLSGE